MPADGGGRAVSPIAGRKPVAVAPARRCAYAVLRRVFEHGAYADRALHGEARSLAERDRALATRLAFGTIQRRDTLDHLIAVLAGRPAASLDAAVLAALRLGLYELMFLHGAPDRAVVADAVELAKSLPSRGGHALVNAVLRRATREGDALLAALEDDTPSGAAIRHSHPEWLARMWWDEFGQEQSVALMQADNEPAEHALRANTLFVGAGELAMLLPVGTHRDSDLPEALVLEGPFDAHGSPLWRAGAFMPQSRAAMMVARALAPHPGERVLDLCAAPGGKTTHLAALMGGEGEIVAVERHAGRAAALERTCRRMSALNVRVEVTDAARPRADDRSFDRVLVDPPCSGLGTLQTRPDLRWRASPEAIRRMAREQSLILDAAAGAVGAGGVLVYSTCTISPDENERQIAAFLDAHPDFSADDLASELPAYAHPHAAHFVLTLPSRHGTAGFFIARLRRGATAPRTRHGSGIARNGSASEGT
jgi:16S rRNA (cytosine967-C5)-methyltransferase